ncbi:Subtilisin-like serine protease [Rhynchospora pubera]|uniref:Subtilisin-like serine protease n=1 Tax=Rhynchospora pubera TaxID=906938 RepID=A0AAV8GBH4_9POAL|nr:Subtilisin-like serine protease [Rhynchospora pubera]
MNTYKVSFVLFLFCTLVCYTIANNDPKNDKKNYIILNHAADDDVDTTDDEKATATHKAMISTVADDADSRLVYSYNKVVNGFAAKLSDAEVQSMTKHPLFVRAIPADKPYKLLTTHTPEFLQLRGTNGLWQRTKNMGEGIIVGVLDTGATPGHPSFDDTGMPPPPKKWKGHCDFDKSACNNKLIGAKSFLKAGAEELKHLPPIDTNEHGTHTASTAAGAAVKNIDMLGIAMGEASGAAPRAHLAVYRVCAATACESPDIFKAIEEAVNDGCDVISLSLGIDGANPFYMDPVALGGFYAILKGVFVTTAAGNSGPNATTVSNYAPWLLTVAASTTDRKIPSSVKLGNGLVFDGESLNQPKNWTSTMLPVVYLLGSASKCVNGTLDSTQVRGKIVVCDRGVNGRVEKGKVVLGAGGAGMILVNLAEDASSTNADFHVLPASHVSYADGNKIKEYIRSTRQSTATFLFKGVQYNAPDAPSIAAFSSRGPSVISPLIIKPDITGPGVSILAGVPPMALPVQNTTVKFNFLSGTSMATPHLSGIAALIKKEHPNWSPAAIRSAMMTTADTTNRAGKPIMDQTGLPADAYAMGSGQVNPNKAMDPGLVYDLVPQDYINYLCGIGYKDKDVNAIIYPAPPIECAKVKAIPEEQLNYPSIALSLVSPIKTISRAVTNVGDASASYKAVLAVPKGISIEVVPPILTFKALNETQSFQIIVKRLGVPVSKVMAGELKWVSPKYSVRSPIIVRT